MDPPLRVLLIATAKRRVVMKRSAVRGPEGLGVVILPEIYS